MYKGDYLIHFGIPGMKWGIRKNRVSTGVRRPVRLSRNERKDMRNFIRRTFDYEKARYRRGDYAKQEEDGKDDYHLIKAENTIIKKYGKKKYNEFNKAEKRREMKAVAGYLAVSLGSIVALNKLGKI